MKKLLTTAIFTIFISSIICAYLFNPSLWYTEEQQEALIQELLSVKRLDRNSKLNFINIEFPIVVQYPQTESMPVLYNLEKIPVMEFNDGNMLDSEKPEMEELLNKIQEADTWKPDEGDIKTIQKFVRESLSHEEVIPDTNLPDFSNQFTNFYTYDSIGNKGKIDIYISDTRKCLIKVYNDEQRFVTLAVCDNIDFENDLDIPEKSIVFNEGTWAVNEDKLIKWQLGVPQNIIELGKKEEKISFSTYQDKIILSYGYRLLAINKEELLEEIVNNCTNGIYKFFEGSLFYSNQRCDLIERNLLTGEETKIDQYVYWIGGQNVQYKKYKNVRDTQKSISVTEYFDLEGKRKEF